MKMPALSIQFIRNFAKGVISPLNDPLGYEALVVMYSTAAAGTNAVDVAKFTGKSLDDVQRIIDRMKESGIIDDREMLVNLFEDENLKQAGIFAHVALGFAHYNPETKTFSLTGPGKLLAEEHRKTVERRSAAFGKLERLLLHQGAVMILEDGTVTGCSIGTPGSHLSLLDAVEAFESKMAEVGSLQ
jgi:DNA-binding Lrp family transcriptional regulator